MLRMVIFLGLTNFININNYCIITGGVFIATLFGLALAMLTLLAEVIYYKKRKPLNKVMEIKPNVGAKPESPKRKRFWFLRKRNKNTPEEADRFNVKKDEFMKEMDGKKEKEVTIGSTFQPVLGTRLKPASDAFVKGKNFMTVYSRPPIHQDDNEWQWERNYLY